MSVSLTGEDTIILNDRILADLADGDCVNIDFPNNLVEGKVGKNGNTIYSLNAQGGVSTVTLRILTGSADDKFLNSQLAAYRNDPASYTLMPAEFVKRAGDGSGNVTADVYKLKGGIVQKIPNAKENKEGDTEQSVSIYQLYFGNTTRIMS